MYAEYNDGRFSVRCVETQPASSPVGEYVHVYVTWRGVKGLPKCFNNPTRDYPRWAQSWSGEVADLATAISELGLPSSSSVRTMRA